MQTKRRRWVHQINTGKPLSKVSGVDTTCAICRGLFCEPCLDCQAEESIDKSVGLLVLKTKELWYTLLLMAKRPPFISLSIDLIRRIYDFSLPEQQHRLWICPIVQIHCGHTYHRHCISKWIAKRPCCPLDNQPLNGQLLADFSADITDITVSPYTLAVLQMYQATGSFVSQSEMQARHYRAQGFLHRWLKKTNPSVWPESALITMYQANTPDADERLSSLESVIAELCEKEFIHRVGGADDNALYQYKP